MFRFILLSCVSLVLLLSVFPRTNSPLEITATPLENNCSSFKFYLHTDYKWARAEFEFNWSRTPAELELNSTVFLFDSSYHNFHQLKPGPGTLQTLENVRHFRSNEIDRFDGLTVSYHFDTTRIKVDIPSNDTAVESREMNSIIELIETTKDSFLVSYCRILKDIYFHRELLDSLYLKTPHVKYFIKESERLKSKRTHHDLH